MHNRSTHVFGTLDRLPLRDATVDGVFCNAVLEHVTDPDTSVVELRRVLKPGGIAYVAVPFLQPEHRDPRDFQRWTAEGLRSLLERHGFEVLRVECLHSAYVTLGWIVEEWLLARRKSLGYRFARVVLFPVLRYLSRRSTVQVPGIASGFRSLSRKPAA